MADHPNDGRADELLEIGLNLVTLMRDDLAAAHRLVDYLNPADARALVCILAALVPEDAPVKHLLTWWHAPAGALVASTLT